MEHLIALLPLLSSMPALQVFVGGAVSITCIAMVLRANKDKHEVPPPTPGGFTDAMVHLQGLAEVLSILRELREQGRQQIELLRSIDREQVRNRGYDRRE